MHQLDNNRVTDNFVRVVYPSCFASVRLAAYSLPIVDKGKTGKTRKTRSWKISASVRDNEPRMNARQREKMISEMEAKCNCLEITRTSFFFSVLFEVYK